MCAVAILSSGLFGASKRCVEKQPHGAAKAPSSGARRCRGASGETGQHGALRAEALPLDAVKVVDVVALAPQLKCKAGRPAPQRRPNI
jgi:predicted carbohydrate-binding protein with CBM5 and CBM33 domain